MSRSFHKLSVKKITTETPDAVTLTFDVPTDLKEKFKYIQGQYLPLKFHLNGKEERRSYSMCSSPIESDLSVTVKKVQGGKVSTHIHQNIKAGDEVRGDAARWSFLYRTP